MSSSGGSAEETGLIVNDTIVVAAEPDRLRIASDDGDLAAIGGIGCIAQQLQHHETIFRPRHTRDRLSGHCGNFGLAFVMRNRQPRMSLNSRQALLGLVENTPGLFNGNVEGPVADDVASAEEIVVLDAIAAQLPLHDAQYVRVVVDAVDDGRLVVDGQPLAPAELVNGTLSLFDPLQATPGIIQVGPIRALLQELIRMV